MVDNNEEYAELTSPLAQEFRELCKQVQDQIDAKLTIANQALDEAEALAEQHGIPFRTSISPLRNVYVPDSFRTGKFASLSKETIEELADISGMYLDEILDYGGWLHSRTC